MLTACRFWLVMGCRAPGKHIQYGFQPVTLPLTCSLCHGHLSSVGQGQEVQGSPIGTGRMGNVLVPTWADSEALLPGQADDGLSLGPDEEEVPRR